MPEMVEVMIDSVRVSLTSQQRIVLLRRMDVERYLPIWIGPYEAEAITIALQEIEMARPQTHDLMLQALSKMNARLARVEIVSLKEDVFYGSLVIENESQTFSIDARPSDSIALAVRAHVPILMAADILDAAGITPEADLQLEPAESGPEAVDENMPNEEPAESKKRLSVFEDFLQNLDMDDENDRPDEKGSDPDSPIPPEES